MEISITRFNGGLQVNPAPPYIVDYLQYTRRSFEKKFYKTVNKYEKQLLCVPAETGGVFTLQGFFTKIFTLITKNKDICKVIDLRDDMPEPDWQRVKDIGLRDYQADMIVDLVQKGAKDSGVLVASGGSGKTFLQMMTYAAWNNLNTILAIPYKEVCNQTYQKFKEHFKDKHIGKMGDGSHDVSQDITISTFKSLKNCSLEKCQMLLVDELQASAGDEIQNVLSQINPIRVFGYTATDKGLFSQADRLIKGLFGERLVYFPYQEAEAAEAVVPCVVNIVRLPYLDIIDSQTIEGKIRKGIKVNISRNKIIGEICANVPHRDWQTIVFVDTIQDHLSQLMKFMPADTRCVHRCAAKKECGVYALSVKQQKINTEDFVNNKYQHLVATNALRAGFDVQNCRVVVQASGGSSVIGLLQEAYRGARVLTEPIRETLGVSPKTHFVLIDFLDEFDETLNNMSLSRIEHYKKQGWEINIVDKVKDIKWETMQTKLL